MIALDECQLSYVVHYKAVKVQSMISVTCTPSPTEHIYYRCGIVHMHSVSRAKPAQVFELH